MLLTLHHSLKNPSTHADLSGRVTSLVSPAQIESMQLWMLELAIGAMMLAVFCGEPKSGKQAVGRILNTKVGSDEYRTLLRIWQSQT
jgi:hypothetical protein